MPSQRVAVVGAGPAGCAAAAELARARSTGLDLDIVVLEKGHPGKDKPCGDAFLPDAVGHLRDLGIDLTPIAGARPFSTVDLWASGTRLWRTGLSPEHGVVAPRAVVDQLLRDSVAHECDLRYGTRVTHIERAQRTWRLSLDDAPTVEADLLVVASGANRHLPAQAGIPTDARVGRSLSVYVEGVLTESADFHFAATPFPGYAWSFPLGSGRGNAGVCSVTADPVPLAAALETFLTSAGLTARGRARGGAGPFFVGAQSRWHDSRGAVACGDAGGLVDELTGEGIGAALASGRLAGRALARHAAGDAMALEDYSRELGRETRHRLADSPARRTWRQLAALPRG